jgi:hypothetical protein
MTASWEAFAKIVTSGDYYWTFINQWWPHRDDFPAPLLPPLLPPPPLPLLSLFVFKPRKKQIIINI